MGKGGGFNPDWHRFPQMDSSLAQNENWEGEKMVSGEKSERKII
jgi:hypothetical protein